MLTGYEVRFTRIALHELIKGDQIDNLIAHMPIELNEEEFSDIEIFSVNHICKHWQDLVAELDALFTGPEWRDHKEIKRLKEIVQIEGMWYTVIHKLSLYNYVGNGDGYHIQQHLQACFRVLDRFFRED